MQGEATEPVVHDVQGGEVSIEWGSDFETFFNDDEPLNFLEDVASPTPPDSPEAPIPSPITPSTTSEQSDDANIEVLSCLPQNVTDAPSSPSLVLDESAEPPSTPDNITEPCHTASEPSGESGQLCPMDEVEEPFLSSIEANELFDEDWEPAGIPFASSRASLQIVQCSWEGYKLVGDNLDWRGKPRHQTLDSRGFEYHAFQIMAVKDRINLSHLSDKHDKPVCLEKDFSAKSLLPTKNDIKAIQQNLCVLVARILTKHIPDFKSLSKYVPSHISHKYSKEMSKKSEVVSDHLI